MRLFKRIKKFNSEKLNNIVIKKDAVKRSALFVIGCFISSFSYNLFYVPNNFVGGGLGGVGIILNKLISADPTFVILVGNAILIVISLFTLGLKKSLMSIIGATTSTIFVYLTKDIPEMINFYFDNILLYVLAAGVVGGFGEGLVYKAGFNTGGTSIIALIIQHYKKKPLGGLLRGISLIIIAAGGFTFGYTSVMYSLLITFMSTYMVDKILIGISASKQFFIQTSKTEEVKAFIIDIIESGVTELDGHGAYSHKKKRMLMCVVPTERYTLLKSAIKELDPDAFIVVNDCYEVLGGTKRQLLSFEEEEI